jgi:hypothetical protein
MDGSAAPTPRYGQTQISIDDTHILVIGGCGGPNQIFSDVWLLTISDHGGKFKGHWDKIRVTDGQNFTPTDFQYAGTKVVMFAIYETNDSSNCRFVNE